MIEGSVLLGERASLRVAHAKYLEMVQVTTEGRVAWFVCERIKGRQPFAGLEGQTLSFPRYETIKNTLLAWPMQALIVEHYVGSSLLHITRNALAMCPLYLHHNKQTVALHWNPVVLYPHLSGEILDKAQCAAFLDGRWAYGAHTVFKDIYRLPERGKFIITPQGVEIVKPPSLAPFEAGQLKAGADPVDRFLSMLHEDMQQWPFDPDKVFCELSSGMDASLVATVLSYIVQPHPLHTVGYVPLNEGREVVRQRRNEAIARTRAQDFGVDIENLFPQAFPRQPYWPYFAPTDFEKAYAAQKVREHGGDIVFSGVGGDELCILASHEREKTVQKPASTLSILPSHLRRPSAPEGWPNGLVPESCHDVGNSIAVTYLRQGIWYAHPLSLPEIQTFAHFLPLEWRKGRRLSRAALERCGYSAAFLQQEPKESLSPSLDALMLSLPHFDAIFENAILVQEGLLDLQKLYQCRDLMRETGDDHAGFLVLLAVSLEMSLKSVFRV